MNEEIYLELGFRTDVFGMISKYDLGVVKKIYNVFYVIT